jgi:hypothetical protein
MYKETLLALIGGRVCTHKEIFIFIDINTYFLYFFPKFTLNDVVFLQFFPIFQNFEFEPGSF